MEPIRFIASMPDTTTLRISGTGAVRLTLDVPESDIGAVVQLLRLIGQAFTVTVEAGEQRGG